MSKILLVEDDNNLREIYGARLIAEGYEIVSAHDGEEALALAIKERPDMILTDIMMPKISGFDMIDILRSTTETKEIKVIIMTALSQPEDQRRGEQLGADKYLVKSQVTLEDVVRATHEVLGDKATEPVAAPVPQPSAPVNPAPAPTPQPEPQVASQFTPQAPVVPAQPAAAPAPVPQPSAPVNPAPAPTPQPQQQPEAARPQNQGSTRVLQPLSDDSRAPSFQELVERELSKEAEQAPQNPASAEQPQSEQNLNPAPPQTPQEPTPPPAI